VVGRYVGIGTTHTIVYIIMHPHYTYIAHYMRMIQHGILGFGFRKIEIILFGLLAGKKICIILSGNKITVFFFCFAVECVF